MLKQLLHFFNPKKVEKKTKKPLALQTHYGATNQTAIKTPPPIITPFEQHIERPPLTKTSTEKMKPKVTFDELILKQQKLLESQSEFRTMKIEQFVLEKKSRVVGFTGGKMWHQGILTYPESIRYTKTWDDLKQKAKKNHTGLGVFEVDKKLPCLKLTSPTGEIQFLISRQNLKLVHSRTPLQNPGDYGTRSMTMTMV